MVSLMHACKAYRDVSSSLWTRLTFFELKSTNTLKSSGWGLEKSELPWEQNWRQRGRVVRALDLKSAGRGFKSRSDRQLMLFSVAPGSKSRLRM